MTIEAPASPPGVQAPPAPGAPRLMGEKAFAARAAAGTGRAVVRTLEVLLVACLLTMVVMIFGNVVLRYGLDSGIVLSEELSRFAFVWMTFVGAILAAREGLHVGVDSLLNVLPGWARRVCMVASELLVIACCAVFFWGTWRQHEVNATMKAAVSGLPLIWVFGVGYVTSIGIALVSLLRIGRLLRGLPLEHHELHGDVA
ncbi:TRAP transporter small permease [Ramlibacter sp. Leaf400]|uniref:TRAP transporter small permease n=1 Tax=Ramlibacter sp. Leaf400 TaxID=1736365 RepID=UPI00138F0DAA|nr:TRAP transporter small permease [Ramlibacter sp. Leaf400]